MSFDAGGTLIEPWPSVGQVYARAAAQCHQARLDPEQLDRNFLKAWAAKKNFDYSRAAWLQLVEQTFQGLLDVPFGQAAFDLLYDRFGTSETWRVHADVVEVLDTLRARGYKLAVISNWDERLRPLLDQLGLSSRFETITVSHDLGCQKPAPAMFLETAAALGMSAGHMLHVGDSRSEDMLGAQQAGSQAAWLRRGQDRAHWPEITSLRALLLTLSSCTSRS